MTTTAATSHDTLLSLADIAALAHVQRPVPSVWRTRSAQSTHPFPEPAHRAAGQEYFSLDDVVEWLEATGLGNNPSVRDEGRLFVALDVIPPAQRAVALDGLTALLALKAQTGLNLGPLTPDELLDLADDVDPHDECLYRELGALGEAVAWWAQHADAVSDAAYSPAGALGTVLSHHRRLGLSDYASTALAESVTELVGRIAVELIDPDRREHTPVVDPTGSGDLLGPLRRNLADVEGPTLLVPKGHSPAARLARRQLITAGWDVRDTTVDDGAVVLPPGSVVVAHMPTATRPDATDTQVVDLVDRVALAMHDDDRGIVVGPASALTNRNRDAEVTRARADVLRTGRVRAIVRLPAGLWLARSRQQLAVWVLGPSHPDVRPDDRWIMVADLASTALDGAVVDDVVTDVVAAMGDRRSVHGHAFRFARLIPASTMQAADDDLVTVAAPLQRPRLSPAEMALKVQTLASRVAASPSPIPIDLTHGDHSGVRVTTLGELVAAKAVRVVPGNRIDIDDVIADGNVPAIGTEELLGVRRRGERAVDRLTFSTGYPSGRYSEPGDVVFCSTPHAGALVDVDGFSVVVSPARVLRLNPDARLGLTPELLAHAIRSAPSRTPWRTWPVRLVPVAQVSPVEGVLRRVHRARIDAQRRLDDLAELADVLIEGVTSGGLTLNHSTEPDDHQAEQEG